MRQNKETDRAFYEVLRTIAVLVGTLILCIVAGILTSGCTPKVQYVPVESVRYERVEADTSKFMALINSLREEIRSKESRTESLIHNEKETVTVNEKGDTIFRDRFIYINLKSEEKKEYERIIERQRDSISNLQTRLESVKADSVPVPYPVERPLTKWEKTKMDFGGMAIGGMIALGLAVVALAVWLIKVKRRR